MTKKQFLDGEPFATYKSAKFFNHKFVVHERKEDGIVGSITERDDYLINVDKVTDKYVYCYRAILGEIVNIRVSLEKLYTKPKDNETQAAS